MDEQPASDDDIRRAMSALAKRRWAGVSAEERARIMAERGKRRLVTLTAEERAEAARKAGSAPRRKRRKS